MAQKLGLPFLEIDASSNEIQNGQLQAVQVLLEGAQVGIQKQQEQVILRERSLEDTVLAF